MSRSSAPWDGEFSAYFARSVRALRTTAYLLCRDWHRAEDLAQAALLKLYLAWPRLSHHDALDAYARRVVVRTFLAENRRVRFRREHLTDAPPEPLSPEPDVEQSVVLADALAAVPPRQRAVLVLRYFNDLSVDETARTLRCSAGTVKSQAARGLATLRQHLPAFPMEGR
ncbi:SigE family RNA polymerase sigma factor [Amycolatopsis sp. NPDC006125]|uniref:SigE family RNA polymerase sigma factor n=1 Tax=Amycolatopsis sp. NPDC006125 TaxID=3156730 RepID=UPI0033B8D9AA